MQLHNEEVAQLTEQLQVLRENYEEKLREYEEQTFVIKRFMQRIAADFMFGYYYAGYES